jgi:NhaC family Na+:H+ antiporter
MDENQIIENKELNIWEALLPIIVLVSLLAWNVYVYGDNALSGSNQFILLIGAAVAAIVGFMNKVSYTSMINEVADNLKSTTNALLILLLVGSLAGTWMLSGIIPTLIYGGLQILSPAIFLPASVVICAVISLATGSSWTTSATVGIALIGIAKAIGVSPGMAAGAVLSGAYFGDKMSPLSDTTNLAASMAGSELFSHIKYMSLTTIPTISVTLIIFIFISLGISTTGTTDSAQLLTDIEAAYNVNVLLMIVPIVVIGLIMKKTKPLIALLIGSLLGGVFALIFQPDLVAKIGGSDTLTFVSGYRGVMDALTVSTAVESSNPILSDLFSTGGMSGMMGTIWLIICALVFGGIMDAIGALQRISAALLSMAKSTFGLFASTVASCLAINVTASDQYLAIVVPGKMFDKAYRDKGLAPENLSRTLEDSGTVTSVLIPWNTCGAYHSGVLGVSVFDYFIYTFFSYISPLMTLLFAALGIKIKQLID